MSQYWYRALYLNLVKSCKKYNNIWLAVSYISLEIREVNRQQFSWVTVSHMKIPDKSPLLVTKIACSSLDIYFSALIENVVENVHATQSKYIWLLQWRHNKSNGVLNHQHLHCLATVCWGADQIKHQSSASLAFVRGIPQWPVNSLQKASNAINVSIWWRLHTLNMLAHIRQPFWCIRVSFPEMCVECHVNMPLSAANSIIMGFNFNIHKQKYILYCYMGIRTDIDVGRCVYYYTSASTKMNWGYTGFTLPLCPSVPLWTESCPLCIFKNTCRIDFIFAHLTK